MIGVRARPAGGVAAAAVLAMLVGILCATEPQLAVLGTFLILCATAFAAPAAYWAIAALVAAVTFRGLVGIDYLPAVATYVDIPLAWGALGVALFARRNDPRPPIARRLLAWLGLLALATGVSWAFSGAEVLRPILYLALLGEPFALIIALVVDPPLPRARRALELTLLVVVLVQIPIALWQASTLGLRDPVQGTLYGAGAGAHTMSAVVVVGAFWLLLSKRYPLIWRLAIVGILAVLPFLADAKQVIFAVPAILIMSRWRRPQDMVLRIAFAVGLVAVLIAVVPAGRSSLNFLREAEAGKGGKEVSARVLWSSARADPAAMMFGQGPAETVSRAAFMTTDLSLNPDSPLRILDLRPAKLAVQAETHAIAVSNGGSSLNSGLSSALGVFGDLGVFGVLAYVGLLGSLLLALRKSHSPEGIAAGAGFAMFALLGLVFDWWEQPPFAVVLAVLAGLALSESPHDAEHAESR